MNVKKIVLPLVAAIIAVAGVFAMGAKKNATVNKADTTWYYISDSTTESAFRNASNWSLTNNDEDCSSTGNRPCQLHTSATTESELQTYLNGISGTVLNSSDGRKPD